jgi:hypothetical protein
MADRAMSVDAWLVLGIAFVAAGVGIVGRAYWRWRRERLVKERAA